MASNGSVRDDGAVGYRYNDRFVICSLGVNAANDSQFLTSGGWSVGVSDWHVAQAAVHGGMVPASVIRGAQDRHGHGSQGGA